MDRAHSVAVWVDADGLLVDEAGMFAAVLVGQVERVAGELHAAGLFALAEVGVVFALITINPSLAHASPSAPISRRGLGLVGRLCLRAISQIRSELRLSYSVDMVAVLSTE